MKKLLNYKTLFWAVLTIALIEGGLLYLSSDLTKRISLPIYSYYDSNDGLVTAEGAWISPIKVAFPLSTTSIECWKDFGYCWIADATIMKFDGEILSSGLKLKKIAYWNDDFVETEPAKPLMGCTEETYRLDRRSETVTYTRRTIKTDENCEETLKDPIVSTLGNGWDRLNSQSQID